MVRLEGVSKTYRGPKGAVKALDGVDLSVSEGEFLVVRGPSGSGKSTLLMTIGCMARPTSGKVYFEETDVYALTGGQRAALRASSVGFVFQMFHLVPYLCVLENVVLQPPTGRGSDDRRRALALLERFGMSERIAHKPPELSTGERQRTALARAMLNSPKLILADEPTGNLDPDNAAEVLSYLKEFNSEGGTVVMVTHEEAAEKHAGRVIQIRQGRLEGDPPA